MNKIRVLIADDSAIYRSQIREALGAFPDVEVAGAVSNGRLACEMLGQSAIDLLILDLEMPEMDGLQTLAEMKARSLFRTKVLLISSFTKRGAEITLDALKLGASDFIAKPGPEGTGTHDLFEKKPSERIRDLIEPKLRALFPLRKAMPATRTITTAAPVVHLPGTVYAKVLWDIFRPQVVVIGSSTGGPNALEEIFSKLKGPLRCPVLIVQHMPPLFTASLAERIEKISGIPAREARNGEALVQNQIYIAPGDYHLVLQGSAHSPVLGLSKSAPENYVRPAVDPLFKSAAQLYREKCLAIVLTGMGSDGRAGAEAVKRAGGAVIIQNKETCVVFGMPGAVAQSGAFDEACTPEEIVTILKGKITCEPKS